MKLTVDQVRHVAHLARLALEPEELERFREQLSAILEYAEVLQELDTQAIPATAMVVPLENVMRPDQAGPSLPREEVLGGAPQREQDCFRVRAIMD